MAIDAITIGISSLKAAEKRLEVSAENVANFRSATTLQNGEVVNNPYQPSIVQQVSVPSAGTQAVVLPVEPATLPLFDPGSAAADSNGIVQYPNVDLVDEAINQMLAAQQYKASLNVIKTGKDLFENVISIIT